MVVGSIFRLKLGLMAEPTIVEVPKGELYLGSSREGEPSILKASELSTHGVIVGMTGSGKTGLGVVMLEEALMSDIPVLIFDPKGDMGNLLLRFPNMAASDFAPWTGIDEASNTAQMWSSGLARSGVDSARISGYADSSDLRIYTPGSSAGIGLDLIGSMSPPRASDYSDPAALAEIMHDEIEGLASTLLRLVGIDSDPMSGREHILLTNIINHYWQQGSPVTVETLIQAVISPPMRKLGVLSVDTLFPEPDRMALAMALNGLAASPAFAAWTAGQDLDIDQLLFSGSEKTQGAIINIHHLSDDERQLVVTTILNKVITWMRRQPGSDELRLLIYIDEVFGFVPPTAMPPSKKPILTLMKQARAFGVGLVLATQNPADIDYKAISNAGTWMIGRLQTERDKDRLLDGMARSDGSVDTSELGTTISSLDKREFVLHSTRRKPQRFSTRWAISYLAGPMSRDQIGFAQPKHIAPLPSSADAGSAAGSGTAAGSGSGVGVSSGPGATVGAFAAATSAQNVNTAPEVTPLADDETRIAPTVAKDVAVRWIHPSAPWGVYVGADFGSRRYAALLAIRVNLLHDDTKADLRYHSEWETMAWIGSERIDFEKAYQYEFDERDYVSEPPADIRYVIPPVEIHKTPFFTRAKKDISEYLYRNSTVELWVNEHLKLYSHIDEGKDAFTQRCQITARDRADEDIAKLRDALLKKESKIRDDLAKLEDRIREVQDRVDRASSDSLVDAFDMIGGLLSGRRRSTRSVRASRRAKGAAQERLRTAENRYADKVHDLEALRREIDEDITEIEFDWDDKARQIETFTVSLERADIRIDEVYLIWVPVDDPNA